MEGKKGTILLPKPRPIRIAAAICLFLALPPCAHAATLNVPANQPTIQAAINAASDNDLILVAPGTYNETIDLLGKAVTLQSTGGPQTTIIDAGGAGQRGDL